jgi:Cu/Ag efflux protein CusF
VRVRIGNLTMTNHPIHLHGHKFAVSCTDGGWVPESAQWPETTTDVPVGAIRAIDFLADNPGDWAFHCHKSHHTMNAMGHDVRNLIGVSKKDLARVVGKLAPDAMVMGSTGMAMGEMEMSMPENTLPMMTGTGQFGPIEMGGMFTTVKIRDGLARDSYADPGRYKNPPGTVAYEIDAPDAEPPRQGKPKEATKPAEMKGIKGMKGMKGMKPHARSERPSSGNANPTNLTKGKKMKLNKLAGAALAISVLASSAASAQDEIVKGVVKKIDAGAGKITLTSGPIKSLDMDDDNMTMVFRVQDPAMLKQVKVGDKVQFAAGMVNGEIAVTSLQKSK